VATVNTVRLAVSIGSPGGIDVVGDLEEDRRLATQGGSAR